MSDAVQIILQKTGKVLTETFEGETVLHLATGLELSRYLVEEGAAIHAKDLIGRTALHRAARVGQPDTVDYLLNQGAYVDSRDDSGHGHSALFYAVDGGHVNTAKVLTERECDLNFEFCDLLV